MRAHPVPQHAPISRLVAAFACSLTVACSNAAHPTPPPPALSASGIPEFDEAMLSPDYWIRRAPAPDAVLLDAGATAAQRAAAYAPGGGFIDVQRLPAVLTRAQIADWIRQAEQTPVRLAVDDAGNAVSRDTLAALRANTAAGRIPATAAAR